MLILIYQKNDNDFKFIDLFQSVSFTVKICFNKPDVCSI